MTLPSKVSSNELDALLRYRLVDQYFEARLIDLPAYTYYPGTAGADATLLAGEVTLGTGGYQRAVIKYETGDLGNYADGGVPMTQKATIFAHDGGATALTFSHAVLVWSDGNVTALGAVTSAPASAATTTSAYTNIPIDSTTGSGVGLTVDLEVTNAGAATTDYLLTINKPGYGYAASEVLTINNATLAGLDATVGAGDLVFPVSTVHTPTNATDGDVFAVAKTSAQVSLVDGNEAAFYWNVKQFGYYGTP